MTDSHDMGISEQQWSDAVRHANRVGGIVAGGRVSFKSDALACVLRPHWDRLVWFAVSVAVCLFYVALAVFPATSDEYNPVDRILTCLFGFLLVFLGGRSLTVAGKVVFNKVSGNIHVCYRKWLGIHHITIPGKQVVLGAYMFKADRGDLKIEYGRTILSLTRLGQPESHLILAAVKNERQAAAVVRDLRSCGMRGPVTDSPNDAPTDGYRRLPAPLPDDWARWVAGSQSKRPYLSIVHSGMDKLAVRGSSERIVIRNKRAWGTVLLVGGGSVLLVLGLAVTWRTNPLLAALSVPMVAWFMTTAYRLAAFANRIVLDGWNSTIRLRSGFHPFTRSLSLPRDRLRVLLYRCDVECANKVKKPGRVVLSLVRDGSTDEELILATADTQARLDPAFNELSRFIGQSSQEALTEELSTADGTKVAIATTSLRGGIGMESRKRRYCAAGDDVAGFRCGWGYVVLCGLLFAMLSASSAIIVLDPGGEATSSREVDSLLSALGGLGAVGALIAVTYFLVRRCVVAHRPTDGLFYSPFLTSRPRSKTLARLSDIRAVQICSVYTHVYDGRSSREATVYEVNVVTDSPAGQRVCVAAGQKYEHLWADAAAFAEFLGVPLLDHTVVRQRSQAKLNPM